MHDIDPDYDFRQRHLTYRVLAMPADTNAYGDIFGGWLMSQIDIAGSIVAIRRAAGIDATESIAMKRDRMCGPGLRLGGPCSSDTATTRSCQAASRNGR